MKHVIVIFLFISSMGFSQTENDFIYRYVDENALFHGGYGDIMMYIAKHTKYPSCLPEEINTCSIIQFVVEKNGVISNVTVSKSSECNVCDKEAVQVVTSMPNWIPAKNNGETVRSYFLIPVQFSLK